MNEVYARKLKERFLRYVAVSSQSDASAFRVPSSSGQMILAHLLADDMKALGLQQVQVNGYAIATGTLPATLPHVPAIGFVAHLDTVDVNLSPDIHPQLLHFDGKDICLNRERDIWLRVAEHPELLKYRGQDIFFSDGTSVLGADNKAAAAIVITMLEIVIAEARPHGEIKIAFVPDEEIGLCGSRLLDLDEFDVDFAYTIDGCEEGELISETFNAASVTIEIEGVTAHPMAARHVMVNPLLVAADLMACFDRSQTPEKTEGREGYWWFAGMEADPARAVLHMHIRDFDKAHYEARKRYVGEAVSLIQSRYPSATLSWKVSDLYGNISNFMGERDRYPVQLMYAAAEELGIRARPVVLRGGTDGAALALRGLVTPNYFTGGLNFHSSAECLPLPAFCRSLDMTLKILELAAKDQEY